jgi:hypothetical protein
MWKITGIKRKSCSIGWLELSVYDPTDTDKGYTWDVCVRNALAAHKFGWAKTEAAAKSAALMAAREMATELYEQVTAAVPLTKPRRRAARSDPHAIQAVARRGRKGWID